MPTIDDLIILEMFSYMSHNLTKCTFLAIFFIFGGGGRPEHAMSKVY